MIKQAVGFIETLGLTAAIDAADAAVKSATVKLIGYEHAKGDGMTLIKIEGDVGAVQAAVRAATASASRIGKVVSAHIIPRPSAGLEALINTKDTVGTVGAAAPKAKPAQTPPPAPPKPEPIVEAKPQEEAPKNIEPEKTQVEAEVPEIKEAAVEVEKPKVSAPPAQKAESIKFQDNSSWRRQDRNKKHNKKR